MSNAIIIDMNETKQTYIACFAKETLSMEMESPLLIKEEGCYMKDYEIDSMGVIVHTTIQHVVDTIKK